MTFVVVVPEVDFLYAIQFPNIQSQAIEYTRGRDQYPAFLFDAESSVHLPADQLFSGAQLWPDFSLSASFCPLRPQGGFLSAVVSPSGTLAQFGLRIADGTGPDSSRVQLYYSDQGDDAPSESTAVIAEFDVSPSLTGYWNRLAMKVKDDDVTLFLECSPHGTVTAVNRTRVLTFQNGSTVYVGQAGPEFSDAKFEVGHHFLKHSKRSAFLRQDHRNLRNSPPKVSTFFRVSYATYLSR